VAGPGQPQLCEAGNETYPAGPKASIGKRSRGSSRLGPTAKFTTRETEASFGENVPEQGTLKALGLVLLYEATG